MEKLVPRILFLIKTIGGKMKLLNTLILVTMICSVGTLAETGKIPSKFRFTLENIQRGVNAPDNLDLELAAGCPYHTLKGLFRGGIIKKTKMVDESFEMALSEFACDGNVNNFYLMLLDNNIIEDTPISVISFKDIVRQTNNDENSAEILLDGNNLLNGQQKKHDVVATVLIERIY